MNKREQLIEYITQDIIAFIVEDKKLDMAEALRMFYTSITYTKLLDQETGLYLESSPYVYDLFLSECKNGYILQEEF